TFAAPPADMITSQLVQWLRASQTFSAVTESGSELTHQWALERRVQDLSIDLSDSKKPQAVLSMQIVMLDETDAVTRMLFEKSYTKRIPIAATDPAAAA